MEAFLHLLLVKPFYSAMRLILPRWFGKGFQRDIQRLIAMLDAGTAEKLLFEVQLARFVLKLGGIFHPWRKYPSSILFKIAQIFLKTIYLDQNFQIFQYVFPFPKLAENLLCFRKTTLVFIGFWILQNHWKNAIFDWFFEKIFETCFVLAGFVQSSLHTVPTFINLLPKAHYFRHIYILWSAHLGCPSHLFCCIVELFQRQWKAAIKVQATWRMYLTKKRLSKADRVLAKFQRAFRCLYSSCRFYY